MIDIKIFIRILIISSLCTFINSINNKDHSSHNINEDIMIIPQRYQEVVSSDSSLNEINKREESVFVEIDGQLWEKGVGSCTYLATWGSLNGVEGAERGPKSGVCSTTRHCVNSPLVPCQGQCKCTGENGGTQGGTKPGNSGGSCICVKDQKPGQRGGWN